MKLLAKHVVLQTWGPVGEPKPNVSGRFCDDIEWMTGRRPGLYWRVTWKVISPLLLLTIFVAYIIFLVWTTLSYKAWNPQYVGPSDGAQGPGICLGPGRAQLWCSQAQMTFMVDKCTLSDPVGSLYCVI